MGSRGFAEALRQEPAKKKKVEDRGDVEGRRRGELPRHRTPGDWCLGPSHCRCHHLVCSLCRALSRSEAAYCGVLSTQRGKAQPRGRQREQQGAPPPPSSPLRPLAAALPARQIPSDPPPTLPTPQELPDFEVAREAKHWEESLRTYPGGAPPEPGDPGHIDTPAESLTWQAPALGAPTLAHPISRP